LSWSPDIYNRRRSRQPHVVNTQTANKLIADVWFAGQTSPKPRPASSKPWSAASSKPWTEYERRKQTHTCAQLMADGTRFPPPIPLICWATPQLQMGRELSGLRPDNPHHFGGFGARPTTGQPHRSIKIMDPVPFGPGDGFFRHSKAAARAAKYSSQPRRVQSCSWFRRGRH